MGGRRKEIQRHRGTGGKREVAKQIRITDRRNSPDWRQAGAAILGHERVGACSKSARRTGKGTRQGARRVRAVKQAVALVERIRSAAGADVWSKSVFDKTFRTLTEIHGDRGRLGRKAAQKQPRHRTESHEHS